MISADEKPFAIERRDGLLRLSGELHLPDAAPIWTALREAASRATDALVIDVSEVTVVDGAVMALLVDVRTNLAARGVEAEIVGASPRVSPLVKLYHGYDAPRGHGRPRRPGSGIERIGDAARVLTRGAGRSVAFLGDMVASLAGVVWRPVTANWRAVFPLMAKAGADAIPIVLALNFLLGFVMGYESSRQLERYGAKLFVADVVGVAVTRELSPVMTGIIMIGRSSAAYAAELGTMRVSDELDALRTMGISPTRFLVLPRVVALFAVTPLLTLLGDVVGVLGGALVGVTRLDVTPQAYLAELRLAIVPFDIVGGLVKASVAGVTIAIIGCQQGFATTGGAAGVGRRTTSTVVISLVALVLIDAFFAVFFHAIGGS